MGRRRSGHKESSDFDQLPVAIADNPQQGDGPTATDGANGLGGKHKKYKQNWRLNMLSVPRVLTAKYVEPEWKLATGVDTDALNAECSDRTEQLAISGMRYLKVNKTLYTPTRGPEYGKLMDTYIDKSWNSIYNYYRKSLHDLKKKKSEQIKRSQRFGSAGSKGRKGKGKGGPKVGKKDSKQSAKSKETIMKEREEWCNERSKPKPVVTPTPIDRGPIVDLYAIKQRQDEIALPKRVYRTPSKDSKFKDPTKVPPAALTYEATDRIKEIALPPPHRLQKADEIIPGAVKQSALKYQISDRMKVLATPKPATTARESDLNEDAFTISPAALKYVATPRMLEMAKPKEYSF